MAAEARSAWQGAGGTEGGCGWMGGELRPKPFRQEIILRLKFIAGLVFTNAVCACTPPHYSVGVARGPDHITYAQRNDGDHNDYLLDCATNSSGQPSNCKTIELPAE